LRVHAMTVHSFPPIHQFHAEGISDVLVIAGPNGVGRLTQGLLEAFRRNDPHANVRMVVQATSPEEREAWGKDCLDTAVRDDMKLLARTIQPS
jgi:hypothetical protein